MSSLPQTLERSFESPSTGGWIEFDEESAYEEEIVTLPEHALTNLDQPASIPVFASIEEMKESPIVLRGEAAEVFARAKRRRVPHSANPIPFD
jgi:hypothetical protein